MFLSLVNCSIMGFRMNLVNFYCNKTQLIYNMKIVKKNTTKQQRNQHKTSSLYFPYCCPQENIQPVSHLQFKKKPHKFIKVTLSKQKQQPSSFITPYNEQKNMLNERSHQQVHSFQSDKFDFLDQIRKFNPNPQIQKEQVSQGKTMNTSKEIQTIKSGQNNLSTLLQNLSNDMFSQMFVSSTIKGKIMLSGSLGSISEVKSEMEISCPTESLVNGLHFTQDL